MAFWSHKRKGSEASFHRCNWNVKLEQEIIVYGWQQFMATVLQVGELKCQLHEQFLAFLHWSVFNSRVKEIENGRCFSHRNLINGWFQFIIAVVRSQCAEKADQNCMTFREFSAVVSGYHQIFFLPSSHSKLLLDFLATR